MSFFNKGKLPNIGLRLKGCKQVINGVDLGAEYERLYNEYSRLYDAKDKNWSALPPDQGELIRELVGALVYIECLDVNPKTYEGLGAIKRLMLASATCRKAITKAKDAGYTC